MSEPVQDAPFGHLGKKASHKLERLAAEASYRFFDDSQSVE
jgi:hypothetical protein